MVGFVVWLTGLSGAGKSTLASLLTQELSAQGVHVECLDGDEVRKNLSHGLGFAREDRNRNVRRIGYVARMVARSGACAITAAISPYEALRDEIRRKTENFVEVYCECPIEVLTERDPKGLYKRALAGEIKNFTGVDDPYEAPKNPEVHLRTDRMSPEECVQGIIAYLRDNGLLRLGQHGGVALPAPFGGEVFEARPLSEEDLSLPRIPIAAGLTDAVRFVAGGFVSPLSGFMTEREATKVARGSALERGTPWWNRPFVLPLTERDEKALNSSEPSERPIAALLQCGEDVVARVTIEDVWGEQPARYAAGSLDAVRGLTTTARRLRRRTMETAAGHAVALYSLGPPSAKSKTAIGGALSVADHVALLVRPQHSSAWLELSADSPGLSLVVVPDEVPLDSERARNVIAKSIGALKVGELQE